LHSAGIQEKDGEFTFKNKDLLEHSDKNYLLSPFMKVGLISDSLTSTAGGIFEIERCLALALTNAEVDIAAWGIRDDRWEKDGPQWGNISCHLRKRTGPGSFGYSPGWVEDLVRSDRDMLHLQHLWMYTSVAVHRWHGKTGKPFLVTANGMLEPWTLQNSGWKKKLAAAIYEKRMFRDAACLQANTEKEVADFRAFGLQNTVCIIPNGVDLPDIGLSAASTEGRRILLFLGRLHPKKGLVNALKAWSEAKVQGGKNWQFVIAGWDQGSHEAELKQLCGKLCLSVGHASSSLSTEEQTDVVFPGPVFGEAKDLLLRQADAFILPSFSEGLPMAVLEAWAYGLPVVMTDQCNLPEGFTHSAAIRIGTGAASVEDGMRQLLAMSDADRERMGRAGRALVEVNFTWDKVATQMKEVYAWILGGGEKPSCVQ
jgi:glycosyltransferase involved in cell wall biosynthesis